MSPVMTLPEVAAWLKIHPATLRRMLKRRAIPAFRIGSDWRFIARDLELWLEQITVVRPPLQRAASLGSRGR
jgi:excisionase family DNA binding protein